MSINQCWLAGLGRRSTHHERKRRTIDNARVRSFIITATDIAFYDSIAAVFLRQWTTTTHRAQTIIRVPFCRSQYQTDWSHGRLGLSIDFNSRVIDCVSLGDFAECFAGMSTATSSVCNNFISITKRAMQGRQYRSRHAPAVAQLNDRGASHFREQRINDG